MMQQDTSAALTPEQLAMLRAELLAELKYLGPEARGGQARRIHDALERWAAGTYGRCLECRKPIPFARLEVMPETPTCIECSWSHELVRH
ncbi:MAG TPA: TraR/DksA C4-type zinc finger protein [Gemmatimonadales bacterium]|nr:TraR/DksA C4-type zinc finger protein [Gemmatimonadales bacterium]